jgi:hypothetical protein
LLPQVNTLVLEFASKRLLVNGRCWPIVLKKSAGNFFSKFSVTAEVQLTHVRVIAAVLKSRVTDLSFPPTQEPSFSTQ